MDPFEMAIQKLLAITGRDQVMAETQLYQTDE